MSSPHESPNGKPPVPALTTRRAPGASTASAPKRIRCESRSGTRSSGSSVSSQFAIDTSALPRLITSTQSVPVQLTSFSTTPDGVVPTAERRAIASSTTGRRRRPAGQTRNDAARRNALPALIDGASPSAFPASAHQTMSADLSWHPRTVTAVASGRIGAIADPVFPKLRGQRPRPRRGGIKSPVDRADDQHVHPFASTRKPRICRAF